jgi:hypothetical protein
MSVYLRAGRSLREAAKNLLGKEVSKDVRKVMKHLARDRSAQLRELRKGDRECDVKFLKKRQNRVGVEPPKPPTLNPKWNPRAEPPEME